MKYIFIVVIFLININCSGVKNISKGPVDHVTMSTEIGDSVHTYVDEMPAFPGGEKLLLQFISHEINYPSMAKYEGIEGKVYVQLVITKYGNIADVKVVKGIGYGCDDEAIRVCKLIP